ncbi:hypothetical protein M918_09875 [Clostridium sp. BL8]|nr:hypothetical protein M918_09875 [Clostridium sp. BL8]
MDKDKVFRDKRVVAIIAALCCLLWGSAYPAVKSGYTLFSIAASDIPSKIVFAGYRFTLAGFIVLLAAQISGKRIFSLSSKDFSRVLILGITQTTLQYIFFLYRAC